MPKMEMKPIAADTEKCTPVSSSASTPPAVATGMLKKTMSESTQFLTALYTRKPMRSSVTGRISFSRSSASLS